ncbi:hypothetical protein R0137_10990 [Congregibacter brevis]|uniref:Uncharacterized protein n=1 Tax=Congregibacter brevis TaxID=3081201 RepID=A0ABZ0I8C4_9GAMM|nr:hypothetical protein R0137_10990 [Congregibacter sp. IMCC45268]
MSLVSEVMPNPQANLEAVRFVGAPYSDDGFAVERASILGWVHCPRTRQGRQHHYLHPVLPSGSVELSDKPAARPESGVSPWYLHDCNRRAGVHLLGQRVELEELTELWRQVFEEE